MKWYFQNARKKAWFAARHPVYALRAVVRDLAFADERFLASVTGCTASAIRRFLHEPPNLAAFAGHLRRSSVELKRCRDATADAYAKKVLIQYAAVRALAPNVVVETGVSNGISSAYLLLALDRNARGCLHSIDVGDTRHLPPGRKIGWIVPEWLRSRWTLHFGDTISRLPQLLDELSHVDIFVHDSLHTYEHMLFEFRAAYPHLRPGGLLVSDDALWNPAFSEFSAEVRSPAAQVLRGVGILKKQPR